MARIVGILFLILLVVKLTANPALSWWWVAAPVLAWIVIVPIMMVVAWWSFGRAMKQAGRQKRK